MAVFTKVAALAAVAGVAAAATVNYDFNITWVTANPDGAFPRPVVGVNGQWPIPKIEADIGDRIVVKVNNQLGNQTTSLHFHGLFMNGTNHMDGPDGVTQCAIPPGQSMTYNFTVSSEMAMPVLAKIRLTRGRSTNPARTGITPTRTPNTPTVFAARSSSTTRTSPTRRKSTTRWS